MIIRPVNPKPYTLIPEPYLRIGPLEASGVTVLHEHFRLETFMVDLPQLRV